MIKRFVLVIGLWVVLGAGVSPLLAQNNQRSGGAKNTAKQEEKDAAETTGKWTGRKRVTFNPVTKRDPMLSPDDILLLQYRERQRLARLEAERRQREEQERQRLAEEERKRQWELMLLKDPSFLIRNKIHVTGIIGQEVMIGGKLYPVGSTYMGAKIVKVGANSVTFSYKGQKFDRKLKL